MKYKICWIDSTLKENWKNRQRLDNVKYTKEADSGDGWIDYEAEHTFWAKSDTEAKEYARNYDFEIRDVEVWSLYNEVGGRLMTEEDL